MVRLRILRKGKRVNEMKTKSKDCGTMVKFGEHSAEKLIRAIELYNRKYIPDLTLYYEFSSSRKLGGGVQLNLYTQDGYGFDVIEW